MDVVVTKGNDDIITDDATWVALNPSKQLKDESYRSLVTIGLLGTPLLGGVTSSERYLVTNLALAGLENVSIIESPKTVHGIMNALKEINDASEDEKKEINELIKGRLIRNLGLMTERNVLNPLLEWYLSALKRDVCRDGSCDPTIFFSYSSNGRSVHETIPLKCDKKSGVCDVNMTFTPFQDLSCATKTQTTVTYRPNYQCNPRG